MTDSPFIHLAVRSSYSLLESMITPKALKAWAIEQSMPALAVSDHNCLFGALEIAETLSAAGIQPIMACCFDVTDGGVRSETTRLTVYAQDETGYLRLMKLSSLAYLENDDGVPRLHERHVFEETDGLIVLTGGTEGLAGRFAVKGKKDEAKEELSRLAAAYPGRCYVEITRHGTADEIASEPVLTELAYELSLPLVATHDARFLKPEDAGAHDALMCIANGEYLGNIDRPRVEPSQYLKTRDEMRELFADLPEAIENTAQIARRCAIKAETHAPILPTFGDGSRSEIDELRAQAEAGLDARLKAAAKLYDTREVYDKRLAYELGVIEKMGFPGYFLIVSDFIKWAKEQDIPVGPGRGSGAGSLVAWSLLITDLDPLQFDLLFERFLNPERISMPDFDIDFCQERRGEVIRYTRDKYGADSVAMIITFGTLQAKAVVRDVGRVMQMPYGQVDRLAKLIPFNPADPPKLIDAILDEPKFEEEKEQDPRVGELLDTALALEGLYRNASTHAAGVVLADRPLVEIAPLYKDPRADLPASQFNMKWAEKGGLVKFDFLGLKTLTVLDRALKFIRRDGGEIGPAWESLDDAATYELMSTGNTLGLFQLEGQGMRDVLKRVKPGNIEDIIAIISLYRPGPMDNIPVFCEGREDPTKIKYQHESLIPILQDTYGVPVYQEQVMRMAQELAGYTLGEADILRRAMGKKDKDEMARQRQRFVKGTEGIQSIKPSLANQIFDTMAKFAGYGFNKSHAAAYAVIAYQTGYLKAHHPVAFMAASMSLDLHNTDKLAAFFQEIKRLEIPLIMPDVNQSTADFDVRGDAVVYALGALKGVGLEAMRHVETLRAEDGAYTCLHDLAERVDPRHVNKKCFEQLAKAGALGALEPQRSRALAAGPTLAAIAGSAAQDRASKQVSLFGESEAAIRSSLPDAKPWNGQVTLDQEFSAVGFYLSGHPLDDVLDSIDRSRITLASEIEDVAVNDKVVELIGVVRKCVEKPARKGGKFAFVTLSDPSGELELMVPPETLEDSRDNLTAGSSVYMGAKIRKNGEEIRLTVVGVKPLEASRVGKRAKALKVRLTPNADLSDLTGILERLRGVPGQDKGDIYIEIRIETGELVTLKMPETYATSLHALQALKSAPCVDAVTMEAA